MVGQRLRPNRYTLTMALPMGMTSEEVGKQGPIKPGSTPGISTMYQMWDTNSNSKLFAEKEEMCPGFCETRTANKQNIPKHQFLVRQGQHLPSLRLDFPYWPVAQMAERLTVNQDVAGSSPARSARSSKHE